MSPTEETEASVLGLVLRALGRLEHGVERIEDRLEIRDRELSGRMDSIEAQRDRDHKFTVTTLLASVGLVITLAAILIQHWK